MLSRDRSVGHRSGEPGVCSGRAAVIPSAGRGCTPRHDAIAEQRSCRHARAVGRHHAEFTLYQRPVAAQCELEPQNVERNEYDADAKCGRSARDRRAADRQYHEQHGQQPEDYRAEHRRWRGAAVRRQRIGGCQGSHRALQCFEPQRHVGDSFVPPVPSASESGPGKGTAASVEVRLFDAHRGPSGNRGSISANSPSSSSSRTISLTEDSSESAMLVLSAAAPLGARLTHE